MLRTLFLLCTLYLISCSDDNADTTGLLDQSPYKPLTDSIKIAPNEPELYYRRGVVLYHNNQPSLAQQDIVKAWQLQPKEEYALSLTTILRKKNIDSAILFLTDAIKVLPESIALRIGLARGYQAKNEFNKSLEILSEVLVQFPNQLDALILKSEILKSQSKFGEALSTLELAYSFAPSDKELAYELAYEYAENSHQKTLPLADSLLKTDATETASRAHYIKATYFKNRNNHSEALKQYDSAIVRHYNFLDAYLDKGELLFNLKRYDEASNTFTTGLRISPATADFFYWLGKTEEAKGNKKEAKSFYQRAFGLDQTMTEAKKAAERL